MPLVRIIKKTVGLIAYVASGDQLEGNPSSPTAQDGSSSGGRDARSRTWLRWITAKESLPEEEPPAGARQATKGIWFLESDAFPSDLPVPEKPPGFWSWLFGPERGE